MRTQATQTDVGHVGKSLPHLALNSRNDRSELISLDAQSNCDGRRRLVKSLSEVTRYEGFDYDIYDTDELPPPPPPPQNPIPTYMPMYPREYQSIWQQHPPYHSRLVQNGKSSESIQSEIIHRCRCHSRPHSDDELLICSPAGGRRLLTKTMSEGEILQEKRKALGFACGYMDIDINIKGGVDNDEVLIEPICIDECSFDLSNSRIFSEESLVTDTDEDVFHENFLSSATLSRQSPEERRYSYSSDTDLITFDPIEFEIEKDKRLRSQLDRISPDSVESPENNVAQQIPSQSIKIDSNMKQELSSDEISPIETSPIADITSLIEGGEHFEESVSESQITVLQKLPRPTGTLLHQTSDSENDSFHMTDPSSAATTPSTKHKNLLIAKSFDEELEEEDARKVSFSSDICVSITTPSLSYSKTSDESSETNIMSKTIDYSSVADEDSRRMKYNSKSYIEPQDEGLISQLVEKIQEHARINEVRKLISPESDSSSSHFTEQESSRSHTSVNTNTINSRSDFSQTDSHPNTDQSVTSEDYITATENSLFYESTDIKKSFSGDERFVISPKIGDIMEDDSFTAKFVSPISVAKTFPGSSEISAFSNVTKTDTIHDLTSTDGETTTSASYHIAAEEENYVFSLKDKSSISPGSSQHSSRTSKQDFDELSMSDKSDESSILLDCKLSSLAITKIIDGIDIPLDSKGAIRKKYTEDRIQKKAIQEHQKYSEESSEDSIDRRDSLTEEEREKIKSAMKLEFPPGVTMFGKTARWNDNEERLRNIRTKKYVQIDTERINRHADPTQRDIDKIVKDKNQSAEITTPGMVRSPAMHEGFRLEDWSVVRTPGTPELFIDAQSSDESYTDARTSFRSDKYERKREKRKQKTDNPIKSEKMNDFNINKYEQSKGPREEELIECTDTHKPNPIPSKITPVRDRFGPTASVIEISIPQPHHMIESVRDTRRRSGDSSMMSWNSNVVDRFRDSNHLLGPGDSLKKADSLRSFSPGSDNVFLGGSSEKIQDLHAHLCTQCGEGSLSRERFFRSPQSQNIDLDRRSYERDLRTRAGSSHRARSEERSSFAKDWGMTAISLELGDTPRNGGDDDERGLYTEAYQAYPWLYVGPNDELLAWKRDALPPPFIPPHARIPGFSYSETATLSDDINDDGSRSGCESPGSTSSEKDFRTRYQAITHRMVHRKSSVEMYRRLMHGTFQLDKTVNVPRDAGEFGFRIHGSRPVVVSAIEAQTPAETSGLEVGDIVLSINNIDVLDASHSDVVRLAHSGSETLRLAVARTCDVLTPLVTNDPTPICAGYLYKLGGAHHSPGSTAISRNWRRRWFALKKDNCLYYYKSEVDQTPLGAVQLLNYSVHALVDSERQFAFTVAKFGGTTLYLAAKTEEARNRWGQVLTQAALQAAQRDDLIEESARRVQQSPGAIATPDCFGYLQKLGSRWHQWKRRYCVIKDACLYLYHDTDATCAIGVVHLHGYRVQSTNIGGKKNAFELIPPEPKFRHFYFCTDSENDKKRWLAGLEYSIDRWIKVG